MSQKGLDVQHEITPQTPLRQQENWRGVANLLGKTYVLVFETVIWRGGSNSPENDKLALVSTTLDRLGGFAMKVRP